MSDLELIDTVAHATGEYARQIRRRGFVLTGPEDSGSNPEPECLLHPRILSPEVPPFVGGQVTASGEMCSGDELPLRIKMPKCWGVGRATRSGD